jgi:hypothetical protein
MNVKKEVLSHPLTIFIKNPIQESQTPSNDIL